MGRVYLARSRSGRLLVVKSILTLLADDPQFRPGSEGRSRRQRR
jgi:hypothetical protein